MGVLMTLYNPIVFSHSSLKYTLFFSTNSGRPDFISLLFLYFKSTIFRSSGPISMNTKGKIFNNVKLTNSWSILLHDAKHKPLSTMMVTFFLFQLELVHYDHRMGT